ncbi:hypothetical protein [Acinetobacter sp. ANC 4470]|uniref:hypothetical protein n=1 Tax=Acinetobacter sp. ANC 4470 TaxID=1977881 RepID=UPI001D174FDB|nr:hypothetical protein [Acinetobacter sp. ANC 4470]
MSNFIVDSANIVSFPRPCTLCESTGNVQKFAGLMLCESCQENIRITNSGMFASNDQIEPKAQD